VEWGAGITRLITNFPHHLLSVHFPWLSMQTDWLLFF
jgi:hypothetical protein